jgi:hypothetical protein
MTTQSSDLIVASILAEDVMKGFSGKIALANSGAILLRPGLQAGPGTSNQVGSTVTVPYFEDGGEAQILTEVAAGDLEGITMSSETATVVLLFKAFAMTALAQMAKATGRDIYEVAREQIQLAFARAIDTLAYTRALARAVAASMEYDGTAANVNTTAIVETLKLFGEELDDSMMAVWALNPKVYWDAAQLADSTGRSLFVGVPGERLTQLGGAPVKMTAKESLVVDGTPDTYKSLLAKKGSMLAWMSDRPKIDIQRDPTADVDMLIANSYLVMHAYGTMPGGTKAGVAVMKTR